MVDDVIATSDIFPFSIPKAVLHRMTGGSRQSKEINGMLYTRYA
jgi:hypothetical protein